MWLCLDTDNKLGSGAYDFFPKFVELKVSYPPPIFSNGSLSALERVRCHGGSANVSDGECLGGLVAIKLLKVNGRDLNGTFRISTLNQPRGFSALSLHLAFMSRDHLLETFVPSQHFTLVGRFSVHRPTLFPHSLRVDV